MKVLLVGNGGREHALAWKIKQSDKVDKIYCAPGNGGIQDLAECVNIPVTDMKGLVQFAQKNKVDLTIAGPELPLTLGVVDHFQQAGLRIFGPSKAAAEIEGSKVFTKDLMAKYNIPSAKYQNFDNAEDAIQYIGNNSPPFVLKADGLAAGKGVIICMSRAEAYDGIEQIMQDKKFGEAGNRMVIEDFMEGEEASVLCITDGETIITLPSAQDHKAIFEGDKGPNTGGMGAYSPAPVITSEMGKIVYDKILKPTINAMEKEGRPYRGVLYAGLMITSEGPKVVEFNCRFGDPEIQAIVPLIDSDIIDLMNGAIDGNLKDIDIRIKNESSVCVVIASGGYPGSYEKGKVIYGAEKRYPETVIFHAGTDFVKNNYVTSGGRVLGVTSTGNTITEAIRTAYHAVGKITFDGAYYRRDIGHRALKRNES